STLVLRGLAVRAAAEPEPQPNDLEPQPQDLDADADVRGLAAAGIRLRRRCRGRRGRGRRRGGAVVGKRRRDECEREDDQREGGETLHLVMPPWGDGEGSRRT